MPKISIIVPVYQVEKYLRKCLDSLVNQTLKDIEILVVNDGSPDQSQKIIDEFQEQFPLKIKSFIKENGGLSDARNFGLDKATGEFIGFVDSDDEVSKTMFEEMYTLAQKHDAEMVICNLQKVDQQGNISQKLTQIPNMPEKIDLRENFSVFSDLSYFACNKIFKRELFENSRFKKGVHFEDIQLIPQLLLKCKTVAQTQNYHYQYLERTGSITKNHSRKGLDILKAVEEVNAAFEKSQYADRKAELKNFNILEGVYTYLAYLAFVKEEDAYQKMEKALKTFVENHHISMKEILIYQRFEKNYLLSLSLRKKIYYILYFSGLGQLMRKLI
ncbi:glycosyltransferase [Chryseobacterium sp. MDT2-18]|uniref:glycosyltransferase family 2 protein n=1 Tax=Chryseobacterium sp. MDT2-18 TaxID=1259136 RepID=UPI002783A7BA|nr:glycosyltransferase [Chryseobacterium sp. MDT2-18]MDQ0476623.1 glycosyltransferase involved in cell wall biosynthesis [Chryseobacterium sp. MDT2-18]